MKRENPVDWRRILHVNKNWEHVAYTHVKNSF